MAKLNSFLGVLLLSASLMFVPTDAMSARKQATVCPPPVVDLCPGYCDNNEWTVLFDGGTYCQWTKETCVQDGDAGTCQGTNTTRPYPCSDGPPR